MDNAALVVWLLTVGGGLTRAAVGRARGGVRQRDEGLELSYRPGADATDVPGLAAGSRRSRLPAWMISAHASLALLGLFFWIC